MKMVLRIMLYMVYLKKKRSLCAHLRFGFYPHAGGTKLYLTVYVRKGKLVYSE